VDGERGVSARPRSRPQAHAHAPLQRSLVHARQRAVVALELDVRLQVERAVRAVLEALRLAGGEKDLVARGDVGVQLARHLRGAGVLVQVRGRGWV